jgi:diadenosine tetraphosphate (Ap4A) HIT family hydrolase
MGVIADYVAAANAGRLPRAVCRLRSGWVVLGDPQVLPGYCVLLADPVIGTLNDLDEPGRAAYLADLARVGDAVLAVTGCVRVNYGILGNVAPELHGHVFPRFADEPDDLRLKAVWRYDWEAAPPFAEAAHGELRDRLRAALADFTDAPP